jgi:hypothetical protein
MIAKLNALLFFALLIAIAMVVFGRLSKRLVFDFRATILSVILAILALIYLYWKSRPAWVEQISLMDTQTKIQMIATVNQTAAAILFFKTVRGLSYVDAPGWQGFFYERLCNSVGCSRMFGLYARLLWPLALMISADWIPFTLTSLVLDKASGLSNPSFDRFASRHNHPSQAEELFDPLASPSRLLMSISV